MHQFLKNYIQDNIIKFIINTLKTIALILYFCKIFSNHINIYMHIKIQFGFIDFFFCQFTRECYILFVFYCVVKFIIKGLFTISMLLFFEKVFIFKLRFYSQKQGYKCIFTPVFDGYFYMLNSRFTSCIFPTLILEIKRFNCLLKKLILSFIKFITLHQMLLFFSLKLLLVLSEPILGLLYCVTKNLIKHISFIQDRLDYFLSFVQKHMFCLVFKCLLNF